MNAFAHRVAIGRRFGSRIEAGDAVFLAGPGRISGLPCTVSDGKRRALSGVNRFMLMQVMKDQAWSDPRFFTADQIKQAGWSISPEAKPTGLQFLVSTGNDGLPLEVPLAKRFHVFNASEIAGVPVAEAVASVLVKDVVTAASQAGFAVGPGGVQDALDGWLSAMPSLGSAADGEAGVQLRIRLASSLLAVQAGLPCGAGRSAEFAAEWVREIGDDPLSFFQAVKDAEVLAASVMGQITAVGIKRQAVEDLALVGKSLDGANAPGKPDAEVGMGRKAGASARVEAMFANRAAMLAVPFADKDRAKALGAVWYGTHSVWFVPKGLDVAAFSQWKPSEHRLSESLRQDMLINEFRNVMASLGMDTSEEVKADGVWHNVEVDSKVGKNKSGSYILSMEGGRHGQPIGTAINKHTGEQLTWSGKGDSLTSEQRATARALTLERATAQAAEDRRIQEIAAGHACEIWAAGVDATGHGYAEKKGISTVSLRQVPGSVLLGFPGFWSEEDRSIIREQDNYLIVPMVNSTGALRAVQVISSDGSVKSFMRGAQKKGCMFVLGAESFEVISRMQGITAVGFVEGIATGLSLHQATSMPVVVCFDAGNFETVVAEVAANLPIGVTPVLAVDNDQFHVERALAFLSDKLAVNPHTKAVDSLPVACQAGVMRVVSLGDAQIDGQWHQVAAGTYCVEARMDGGFVRSVHVSVVPSDGGRKSSASFSNRGIEAGLAVLPNVCRAKQGAGPVLAAPYFASLDGRPTDWNDLAQREGLAAVRSALREQGVSVREPLKESAQRIGNEPVRRVAAVVR